MRVCLNTTSSFIWFWLMIITVRSCSYFVSTSIRRHGYFILIYWILSRQRSYLVILLASDRTTLEPRQYSLGIYFLTFLIFWLPTSFTFILQEDHRSGMRGPSCVVGHKGYFLSSCGQVEGAAELRGVAEGHGWPQPAWRPPGEQVPLDLPTAFL